MWALEASYEPRPDPNPVLRGTPIGLLLAVAGGLGVCAVLVAVESLPSVTLRIAGVSVGHGALLTTALAWAADGESLPGPFGCTALLPFVVLAGAAALAALAPAGALGYLAVPITVWWLASRGGARRLGLGQPVPAPAVLLGLLVGAFLGAHLLISATRTLGYRARVDSLAVLAGALAYDAGANVLAAECFFRGALFDRLVRRWSFAPAAAVATAACVLRYLIDPLLPKSPELIVGGVFYIGLQSAASCWLFWWSGSLVPGFVGALAFFAAYRLLGAG